MYKANVVRDMGIALADQNLLISAERLRARLGQPDLRVIDCRFDLAQADAGRNSYLEGHIPSAVYADLDKDLAGQPEPETGRHPLPSISALTATFCRLGIASNTEVVVYDDRSGALAARTWWLLRWLGHTKTSLLDGGLARWNQLAYPLDKGDSAVTKANFIARKRSGMVLETEEIVANGNSCEALRLVDARDAIRFRGEAEPIDSVAGHIPGALNMPLDTSLNDDGTWKRQEQLQVLWQTVLGEDENQAWSVMCGSGVTACHLAISGLLAGRSEPRLYVGSWSEWIRDPGRQVVTFEP